MPEHFEQSDGQQDVGFSSPVEGDKWMGSTPEHAEQRLDLALDWKPERAQSETPVLLAPGWGEDAVVFEGTARVLLEQGRRVLCLEHPRHGSPTPPVEGFDLGREPYPAAGYQRALNMLALIRAKGDEPVDVLAHSQGGIDAVIAASIDPSKFRNLVLVNPGGMIGPDTLPRLAYRFAKKLPHDSILQRREAAKYIAGNPKRALVETIAIARSEVDSALADLKAAGVGIVIVAGVDDPVFPMERMQQTFSRPRDASGQPIGQPNSQTRLDGFVSTRGSHDELHRHPEQYTRAAASILASLEERSRH